MTHDGHGLSLEQMMELVAQAVPPPRFIVGFPFVPHDFIAIHDRPDSQRLLLVGRGAYENMREHAEVKTVADEYRATLGLRVEFWNWTEHKDITRAVMNDLGYTSMQRWPPPDLWRIIGPLDPSPPQAPRDEHGKT